MESTLECTHTHTHLPTRQHVHTFTDSGLHRNLFPTLKRLFSMNNGYKIMNQCSLQTAALKTQYLIEIDPSSPRHYPHLRNQWGEAVCRDDSRSARNEKEALGSTRVSSQPLTNKCVYGESKAEGET